METALSSLTSACVNTEYESILNEQTNSDLFWLCSPACCDTADAVVIHSCHTLRIFFKEKEVAAHFPAPHEPACIHPIRAGAP